MSRYRRRFGTRHAFAILLLISTILVPLAGCRQSRDRSGMLKSVPTEDFRIEGSKTGMGEMVITLPKPFVVDAAGGDQRDNFFFTDLSDTGEVQKGMIYISVGLTPLPFIPDSVEVVKTGGTIAGEEIDWRESEDITAAGERLYRRETTTRELLKLVPSPGTTGGYMMQVFISGTDPVLVERLMASVESIRPVSKGNL